MAQSAAQADGAPCRSAVTENCTQFVADTEVGMDRAVP